MRQMNHEKELGHVNERDFPGVRETEIAAASSSILAVAGEAEWSCIPEHFPLAPGTFCVCVQRLVQKVPQLPGTKGERSNEREGPKYPSFRGLPLASTTL